MITVTTITRHVLAPHGAYFVARNVPFFGGLFTVPKFLVESPSVITPLGRMRVRGWVWRRKNATPFPTVYTASRAIKRNSRHKEYVSA